MSEPKHTIRDLDLFQKGREKIGGLIIQGMKTTGGTDIDWLVEHNGKFLILEIKEFHNDVIPIPVGQIIAYLRLRDALNKGSKCYFLVVGSEDIDFKNPNETIWYFELSKWYDMPKEKSQQGKAYLIKKQDMDTVNLGNFREMIESYWNEFEKP